MGEVFKEISGLSKAYGIESIKEEKGRGGQFPRDK